MIGESGPGQEEAVHELLVVGLGDAATAVTHHPEGQHGFARELAVAEHVHVLQEVGEVDLRIVLVNTTPSASKSNDTKRRSANGCVDYTPRMPIFSRKLAMSMNCCFSATYRKLRC